MTDPLHREVGCRNRVSVEDLSLEIRRPSEGAMYTSTEIPSDTTVEGEDTHAGVVEITPLAEAVAVLEHKIISEAIVQCDHNISKTARVLGIDRNTLKRKRERYGIV